MFFRCEADIFILFQLFEVQRLQSFKRYKDEPPEDGYICIWHKKNKEEEKLITVPRTSIFSPTWTSLMSFSTSSFFAVVGYHVLHMSFWPLSFLLSTPNYQQHPCFFLMTLVKKWQTKAFVWATVVYKASFPVTSSWSNNSTLALNHLNNNRTL